jgi:DNA-binding transcriptional ArsR family regulator
MRRDVFQAIADPVRREIIDVLSQHPLTVNEVSDRFDISRPAVSKHLKILKECDVIEVLEKGRERICMIKPKNLVPAFMWIEQYKKLWEEKIDFFEEYVNKLNDKNENNG